MCINLILLPCEPRADAGFLIMESDEYPPMSGGNTICTATELLETGMVKMTGPVTKLLLDTPSGLVRVTADCEDGRCMAVAFHGVPSFVHKLDLPADQRDHPVFNAYVPPSVGLRIAELGTVKVDIAWGGMHYAIVDARSVGLQITNAHGPKLIEMDERIMQAVQNTYTPIHPDNDRIRGVTIAESTEPLRQEDGNKDAVNTVVVSPGRFDRCPRGTGNSARMAVLHARGELQVGESFVHHGIIVSTFLCHIRGATTVGQFDPVLSTVKGSSWITGFKQMLLDPSEYFSTGFRVSDQ